MLKPCRTNRAERQCVAEEGEVNLALSPLQQIRHTDWCYCFAEILWLRTEKNKITVHTHTHAEDAHAQLHKHKQLCN